MKIVVVFESMFGNTRRVALEIAEGLASYGSVRVTNVNDVGAKTAADSADLLVVGGPTHVHGMSRPASRAEAAKWADDETRNLHLESGAPGAGVRDWIDWLDRVPAWCASFDTRADAPQLFTGAASRRIEHALIKRGARSAHGSASFVVSKQNTLENGELDRARAWGADVGATARPLVADPTASRS